MNSLTHRHEFRYRLEDSPKSQYSLFRSLTDQGVDADAACGALACLYHSAPDEPYEPDEDDLGSYLEWSDRQQAMEDLHARDRWEDEQEAMWLASRSG